MAERIEVLIPEKEVEAAIDRVADQINRDFEGVFLRGIQAGRV